MCGIVGIFMTEADGGIPFHSLKKMLNALHHRGPDESGIYIDDQVGLGQARLSIIDLEGGRQPIHNEDSTLWIVCNGEIYNYIELREELLKKGHHFHTHSDTEVILHLFEEKSHECLHELNGQFAFAIWDTTKKELFLARDRVGIRPLQYAFVNGVLYFASEIKSLFMAEKISREVNPIALDQIFTFWTTLPGHTFFKHIHELKPGHYLRCRNGRVSLKTFWDIPLYHRDQYVSSSPHKIKEEIQKLLLEAVRIRLRADLPAGAYLSGGLDSSGIAALVKNHFNNRLCTFGICFEEKDFDERTHQEEVASFLNINHKELYVSNSVIADHFAKTIWHCEKPLLRTAPVPLLLLSKLVRENDLKVVLTGEGADEVFGGYNIFREALVRRFWARQPDSQRRAKLIESLYPHIFKDSFSKKTLAYFFGQGLNDTSDPLFSHMIRWKNTSRLKSLFSEDIRNEIGNYSGYEEIKNELPENFNSYDGLSQAQYLEMKVFMSNYLLSSQGDRVAMANSLEIRMPYLDHRIIDFMAHVPTVWKILGLDEKHILKKSFQGILPDSVTSRPKHPYRAPIQQCLSYSPKENHILKDMLTEEQLKRSGLFDVKKVRFIHDKLQAGKRESEMDGMALAGILSSQLVFFQFVKNFSNASFPLSDPDILIDERTTAVG
jgi:asparagine synthase (glutamine-hydrolysing)